MKITAFMDVELSSQRADGSQDWMVCGTFENGDTFYRLVAGSRASNTDAAQSAAALDLRASLP